MAPTGNQPPEGSGAILNQFPFLSLPFSTKLRRQRAAGPAHAARPRSLALPPRWPLPSGSALPSPFPERPPTPPQLFSCSSATAPAAPAPLPTPVLPNCGATSPQPARPLRIARPVPVLVLRPSLPPSRSPLPTGGSSVRIPPPGAGYPSAAARGWRRDEKGAGPRRNRCRTRAWRARARCGCGHRSAFGVRGRDPRPFPAPGIKVPLREENALPIPLVGE